MKRSLLRILSIAGALVVFSGLTKVQAQVNVYGYSTTTGNTLETGGFTNLLGNSNDDVASAVTNIGFTFNFGGTNYTQFSASSNGLMRLGPVATVTTFGNNLAGLGAAAYLAPWWDDLYTASNGNVQYKLMGVTPNQKLVVEWNTTNCCPGTPFDKTFQVWLFETSNTIMFVYGTGSNPGSSTVSISTNGTTDFQSVTTSSNTVSTVTANDGNATWPGSGRAYIFNPPVPTDAQSLGLIAPLTTGCYTNTETVSMSVRNNGTAAIDFTTNNMTVTVNVTGAVVTTLNVTLTDNSLNGGLPLAPGATFTVPVGILDMTTVGTYTFNGNVALTGDGNASNDAMSPTNRIVSGGTMSVASNDICSGDSLTLNLAANTLGTIQWQDSIPGGSWNDIAGGTTNPFTLLPIDTAYYRAVVCGNLYSTIEVVNVNFFGPPTTIDTSRCGIGPVDLIGNGNGTIFWWDQMTGGTIIGTGDTLTVNVTSDTTFYAANGSGTPPTPYTTTFAGGNGANGNMFGITALNTISVTNFDINFTGTGDFSVYYRPDNYALVPGANTSIAGWTLLGTAPGITGAGAGLPTPIPVTFNVTIPAGSTYSFHIISTATLVNYTNGTALNNVYSSNADLQFREGHGCGGVGSCFNVPRVFNGNIYYSSGCQSTRTALNVNFTPATPINLTTASTSICDVDTITLTTISTNTSYSYEYSPSTYLQDTTGTSVNGWPQSNITYVVSALDTAGCAITDTISIAVAHAPTGTMTMSDDFTCFGDSVTLNVVAIAGGMFFSSGPPTPIIDAYAPGSYDTIVVAGAQSFLNTGDLDSVCINLTHTFDADITITLISPAGTLFDLSINEGGAGDNYTNTCFKMSALTPISFGTAPFPGAYIPDGPGGFDTFNGENANGNWMLWIVDGAGGDSGNLLDWNITFAPVHPPVIWSSIPAGLNDTSHNVGVAPTVTTTYIVSITDSSNGCTRNYLDTVVVNPLPIVSLGPDTSICSNYAGITLDGTNPGAGTYLWQDGQTGNTYFAMIAGTYAVAVTDTNGCIGSDTIDVGMITAQVVSIDANLTGIHDADLDAGPGFTSYDWSTTQTSQVINVTTNGTYYVTCVDQNGCVSTDSLNIVFSLGLNNNGTETTAQLYPNPSDGGVFSLAINNLETSDLVIEILDMQGKVVHNRVIGEVSGSTIQPFNLADLRAGAYNLRMIANGKTSTIRFIVK